MIREASEHLIAGMSKPLLQKCCIFRIQKRHFKICNKYVLKIIVIGYKLSLKLVLTKT
jgi:hypothetical protein